MTPPPVRVTASAITHHTAWARFVCYPSLLSHFLEGGSPPGRCYAFLLNCLALLALPCWSLMPRARSMSAGASVMRSLPLRPARVHGVGEPCRRERGNCGERGDEQADELRHGVLPAPTSAGAGRGDGGLPRFRFR